VKLHRPRAVDLMLLDEGLKLLAVLDSTQQRIARA
jgi:hypothetical protein